MEIQHPPGLAPKCISNLTGASHWLDVRARKWKGESETMMGPRTVVISETFTLPFDKMGETI